MAVKPITNKQVVASSKINRGKQVSTKNTTAKNGNRSRTYIPGNNYSKNYSITLKDVDSAILNHIKKVIKPKVREVNETTDVTVMYGNEERWKSVRKRGVMRDKNGSIILPLIMLRRTDISRNDTLSGQSFKHDVTGENIQVVRNSSWSKDNYYDRFSVQTNIQPKYENLVTSMPDFTDITYEFVLWTNFIEQMNPLVETFVEQSNKYWGNSEEYKFLCTMDAISDASEMSSDGERFVKSTFSIISKAYLLPEYLNSVITGKTANLRRQLTTSRVVFGYETNFSGGDVDSPTGKSFNPTSPPVRITSVPAGESDSGEGKGGSL